MRLVLPGLVGLVVVLSAALLFPLRSDPLPVSVAESEPLAVPVPAAVAPPRLVLPANADSDAGGTWVSLAEQPWESASTGWLVLADYDTPERNQSFIFGPMMIAGERFARGVSTYPFSEIVYALEGRGRRFAARVGVTDDSKDGAGSVRFSVYGDEFLLYASDVVRAGEPARTIDLRVDGLHELRLLVDDAGDGSLGDYALWADPMLLTSSSPPPAEAQLIIQAARTEQAARETPLRQAERLALERAARRDQEIAARHPGDGAQMAFDVSAATFVLANDEVLATLGSGGPRNGQLRLQRRGTEPAALLEVTPSLVTRDGAALRLGELAPERAESADLRRVTDPARGPAAQITARYVPPRGDGRVIVTLTLPDADPVLDVQITTEQLPLAAVRYLDAGTVVLGDDVRYLSDRSHLYAGQVRPDEHLRRAPLETTKPALFWSERTGQGMLLTFFDAAPAPAWLTMRRQPGRESFTLGLELSAELDGFGPAADRAPTLSIELTEGPPGDATFRRFQQVTRTRYPLLPWPPHARYQWGSWYTYGPGVDAAGLYRQIDLLAANFTDLGPWLFAIDAGWYVQYGREDAELTTVDWAKFPQGVRGVADAAHARGMNVILYLGTGFVHDSTADGGEWLALRGFIDRYPQWLIPFQCGHAGPPQPTSLPPGTAARTGDRSVAHAMCLSPSGVRRYLLDYENPELRAYLANIIHDFFVVHGADGILLDGVADAEGQLIPRIERDTPTGPPHPLLPALELYRFIRAEAERHRPGAFIESGWLQPTASDPYLNAFWYGDDLGVTEERYPFAGFLARLDYALYSRRVLGQRPYVGTASGDPNTPEARWRVQAAVALGAHATLSYDLGRMSPQTVAAFRADLAALDPFQGTTTYGPGLFPDTFATTRDGVTYLGVVNRAMTARAIVVPLASHGVVGPATAFAVDTGTALRVDGDFTVTLPARSFRLYVLRRSAGLLWTASAAVADCGVLAADCPGRISLTARGPAAVPGFLYLATPSPATVSVDGVPLRRAASPGPGTYAYDDASGLLSLAYPHRGERRIEVRWEPTASGRA